MTKEDWIETLDKKSLMYWMATHHPPWWLQPVISIVAILVSLLALWIGVKLSPK